MRQVLYLATHPVLFTGGGVCCTAPTFHKGSAQP